MTIGKHVLNEDFQPRTFSGKQALKSGHAQGNYEKAVIDVDNLDDLIIIDVAKSFQKKIRVSSVLRKHRKYPVPCVIVIDDEDETVDVADPVLVAKSDKMRADDTSTCTKTPASGHFPGFMCFKCDECLFTKGKKSSFKFSKCRQAFSANASGRSCYGMGTSFASESFDGDCSDCEVMEGSFVQWEKASVKRKRHFGKDQSAVDGRPSSSCDKNKNDPDFDVGTDNRRKEYTQNVTVSGQRSYSAKNTEYLHAARTCREDDKTTVLNSKFSPMSSGCNFSDEGPFKSHVDELNLKCEEISLSEVIHSRAKYSQNERFLSASRELSEDSDERRTHEGNQSSSGRRVISFNREKLKVCEEEWASRYRELQLQQERRKKAGSIRLLDMERRQRQRVEEVRETQKKDEETMNLKEQLRIEIRKELSKLESMSHDMASLLRSLGIQVRGGFDPTSHEVRAAYKRALLKFHPDRASKTDIRQHVEAEEKFKLITLMKDRFLYT